MLAWQIWLIIAGICFVIEILTVGFLVFWFAIAALITSILSLFITNIIAQITIFIILSVILILCTRSFAKKITKGDNTITNSYSVIGKEGIVSKEINMQKDKPGQVRVGSDVWTAICDDQNNTIIPVGTKVSILKIDGVKLIVQSLK